MAIRGIRGAITVPANDKGEIVSATKELLQSLVAENGLDMAEIASALFSTTRDLNAEFPAVAAREIGWHETPLFCVSEIEVPGSLPLCIRVLLHVNTDRPQTAMRHSYLRAAKDLRR